MWIAEQPVVFLHPNGARKDGHIAFGAPYRGETGDWRCPVSLKGFEGRGPDIVGDTSLQALLLATRFAGYRLYDFCERGGRVLYPSVDGEPDAEVPLEASFGPLLCHPPE